MNYKKLVPPESFIGQYMEYMNNVETASSYDFWCALYAIGVSSGRTVYVNRPSAPVFLNWYIILAAESGITRKSTAISSIKQLLIDTGHNTVSGKTSPEMLELMMSDMSKETNSAQVNFTVSELVTILGKEGYMATMPGLLTDLYDSPAVRISPGSLKSGRLEQHNVYINFLSASTPSWLVTAINPPVIEGGFTSRVAFIVDDTRKRSIAWPIPNDKESYQELLRKFKECCERAKDIGAININGTARSKFISWYNNRTSSNDAFLKSYESREDDHVLRAAACLAINDRTYELQAKHIGTACKLIADVKSRASKLFGSGYDTTTRIGDSVGRVREILIEAGLDGIKHTTLYKRINHKMDSKEFTLLMSIMHESDLIQVFQIEKGGKLYRATKNIESFGVLTEVLDKLTVGGSSRK